jgi:hypothetical protein
MDIIKKLIKLNESNLNSNIESLISKSIDTRKIIYGDKTSTENKIKLLVNDTFLFNLYSSCLFLLESITVDKNEKEIYTTQLKKLQNYNIQYNTDIELLKKIIEIYKQLSKDKNEEDTKFFLLRTIKSMEKYGTCSKDHMKVINLLHNIDNIENLIINILDKPLKINIDRNKIDAQSESIMSSVYPNKQNMIYIDKNKYYYLVKKISDRNVRLYLEKQYMKRYNELLPAIIKLIISRKIYGELLGYESYYKFASNKTDEDTENLKIMLKDLNEKLDFKLASIVDTIKKLSNINNNDKLCISDIIYGLNKFFPEIKLKPIDIFQIAFIHIQHVFKVKFSESKITPLNRNCKPIEIYDSKNNLRGYLFLDLANNKNVKHLTLIKLSSGYGENLPVLYLIGPYTDMEKNICNYSDVVTIFRELGFVISNIFSHTPLGINENDLELINFFPDLLEYMAYDLNVIKFLVKDKNKCKQILKARENEIIINLKLKCINVLFDSIIHSSTEFITLAKKANDTQLIKIMLDLYKKVFIDVFSKLTDQIDCDLGFILPSVIINTVNGQQGLIYGNILSMILAYNAYEFLNKNKENNAVLIELLENKNYSFKKNLIKFISTINQDYYKNFLNGCLKIKDISLDNYFDEGITEAKNETETYEEVI